MKLRTLSSTLGTLLFLSLGTTVPSAGLWASQPSSSDPQAALEKANQAALEKANIDELVAESDQIIGLEAIVAEGSDDAFYSRFGHAMLRFVKADGNFTTDKVLSLLANVDLDQIKVSKGIFGGYQVLPFVDSLGNFWKEYVEGEKRPLIRYVILSTPAMRAKLISTLKAWYDHPGDRKMSGDYTFLNNNCVGALARLLEQSGFPSVDGANPVIPANFDRWLAHSLLSPFPGLVVQTSSALMAKTEALLRVPADALSSGKGWPDGAASILEANLSDLQIKQLLTELPNMPYAVREVLVQGHHFGNGGATLNDVLAFRVLPSDFYGTCGDEACAKGVVASAQSIWSPSDWKNAVKADAYSYWLAFGFDHETMDTLSVTYRENPADAPESIARAPAIVRYYQLLLR